MWGLISGKKNKKENRSQVFSTVQTASSQPSQASPSAESPQPLAPGFIAPLDPFALYFAMPIECSGNFNETLKRHIRRRPACVESVTTRRGQPHKIYLRKSFPVLRNLIANLTGGVVYLRKGFRIRDLYYVRRSLLNLLVRTSTDPAAADGASPSSPEGSSSSSPSDHGKEHMPEEEDADGSLSADQFDKAPIKLGGGPADAPPAELVDSQYIIEDESGADLYASVMRAISAHQTQILQSVGVYNYGQTGQPLPPGLLEFAAWLEGLFAHRIQEARDTAFSGLVSFDSLEHLYRPGSLVYGTSEDTGASLLGLRVIHTEYRVTRSDFGTTRSFRAEAEFVVATGEDSFISARHQFSIGEFMMKRSLDSMEWRPMSEDLRQTLAVRGRKYVSLANGNHFMAYACSGFSIHRFSTTSNAQVVQRSAFLRTNGRVMIDNATAARLGHFPCNSHTNWGLGASLRSALQESKNAAQNAATMALQNPGYHHNNHHNAQQQQLPFEKVPRSFLPITYPAVAGFSFTSKTWGHCLVDAISDIQFNERAFDQLVMAPSRKALIRALVVHTDDLFSDIIQGKGSSTVFLLHGPPGSGKTLSAESIAESLHKPLYSITMGELGVTPEALEERIQEVLQLASLWGCLVLIDEADIVVERRNTKDLKRNALVGILLRQLEYFNGVLFLTSNRVSVFDEAVHSRVTIALKYKALSRKSRFDVWRVLLEAAGVPEIDPSSLSEFRLNGRQIKNAIRLGEALARAHGEKLALHHLQHTIAVSREFLELLQDRVGPRRDSDSDTDSEDPIDLAFASTSSARPEFS